MSNMTTAEEAVDAKVQHKKPCRDCPWRREAIQGWLGGGTIDQWIKQAHSDNVTDCHTLRGAQCAGMAIYRRNVAKLPYPPNLILEADREKVFSNPNEFRKHHERFSD